MKLNPKLAAFVFWLLTFQFLAADGYGTAFFITADGYLITNHHVIDEAESVQIRFNENWISVNVVRTDAVNDIAVLKARGKDYPVIPLNFDADARPGDSVFTIGFPDPGVLGFAAKTTKGEISSLSGIKDDPRFI